jgi:phenylalanyl-tRNA synthetase beta chain
MKFSVNWLREFVELPSKVEELAELLTLAGIEIEGTQTRGANFDKVIVAQINASEQHPNADRLSVCQVDDGSGQPRQIVCGAKNYKVGDKVPLALPGAVLVGDLKIKPSKLRGIESQGMLCSPSELGLTDDSDGLLILSPEARIGEPIASLFPADTILEVEITPNRGDLLSHFGLAREIAAIRGTSFRAERSEVEEPRGNVDGKATGSLDFARDDGSIKISALAECPFYSARRIENIKVGPSPDWLRARVEAVGLRSINNIVDVTNFVMLELGQPLHAFDADKLSGGIKVRLAKTGEKFLALDGKTYSLSDRDLVIADDARAVGIAGVMGGEDTGVTDSTTTLLLESAFFNPSSVRRTARTLSLPSDASYRFERRVDPGLVLAASNRASELMREIAGAKPAAEIATAGTLPLPPADVSVRYQHVDELIGVSVSPQRVDEILQRFGLEKAGSSGEEQSSWRIPSHRFDLQRDVDLIEEVVRVFGIAHVPGRDRSRFTPRSEADRAYDFESALRQRLVGLGLVESRTSTLISRAEIPAQGAVELKNPLSDDHVALRPVLLPGMLKVVKRNLSSGARSIRLFEIGRTFLPPDAAEGRALGIVLSGVADGMVHWRSSSKRSLDFFDLKGVIEAVLPNLVFQRRSDCAEALSAVLELDGNAIGFASQLSAIQATELGATAPVLFAQVDVGQIFEIAQKMPGFSEIDKFPAITRDIAMIVPENLAHEKIMGTIANANEPLLASVELFDVFSGNEGQNFGAGKKSMAYALTYRDKTRTLTNDEISVVHAKIRERLQRELGVELRE